MKPSDFQKTIQCQFEFLGRNLANPANLYGKDEIMILTDYLIEEMVRELKRIFGENIQQIILFGSTARMDAAPDSDIDIAVILRQELSHDKRVEFLEWSAEFDMKYEKVFSFIDIEKEKMEQWGDILPFYKNIQKEGIDYAVFHAMRAGNILNGYDSSKHSGVIAYFNSRSSRNERSVLCHLRALVS